MPWIIAILCNFKLFFNVDHFLKLLNDLLQYLFCLCVCVCLVSFLFGRGGVAKSCWTSLVAQMVKHLPTMPETQVQSLGREDPLEKEMATHSSLLAWRIPWTEEPGGLQSMGSQRVGHD